MIRGLVVIGMLLSVGCATTAQRFELRPEVVNALALCLGQFSSSAELRAEFVAREGRLITSNEIAQRGESAFEFGELQGRDAIDMFNSLAQCTHNNMRLLLGSESEDSTGQTGQAAQAPLPPSGLSVAVPIEDNDVEVVSCSNAVRLDKISTTYTCILRNSDRIRNRNCILNVVCVDAPGGEIAETFWNSVHHFTMYPGSVREMSGSVLCDPEAERLAVAKSLSCGL